MIFKDRQQHSKRNIIKTNWINPCGFIYCPQTKARIIRVRCQTRRWCPSHRCKKRHV